MEGLQERRGVWEESSSVMRDALSTQLTHCLLCRYRVAKKRVLLDVADGLRRNIACLVSAPTLCPTHAPVPVCLSIRLLLCVPRVSLFFG